MALRAKLDEVRALQGGLRKQDAVARDDSHLMSHPVGEAAGERLAIPRFELMESAAVHQSCNDLPHLKALAGIAGDETVQVASGIQRLVDVDATRLHGF